MRGQLHFIRVWFILYLYVRHGNLLHRVLPRKGAAGGKETWISQWEIPSRPAKNTRAEVLRVGMDFKIRCTGCGREVMLPRAKIEKNIKKVLKPGAAE